LIRARRSSEVDVMESINRHYSFVDARSCSCACCTRAPLVLTVHAIDTRYYCTNADRESPRLSSRIRPSSKIYHEIVPAIRAQRSPIATVTNEISATRDSSRPKDLLSSAPRLARFYDRRGVVHKSIVLMEKKFFIFFFIRIQIKIKRMCSEFRFCF